MQQKHACLLQLKGYELKNRETNRTKIHAVAMLPNRSSPLPANKCQQSITQKLADEKEEEEEAMFRGAYKSVNAIDVQYVNRELPFSSQSGKIANDNANRIE